MKAAIRPKERDAIIQSLRAGVVPRVGQQHSLRPGTWCTKACRGRCVAEP